MNGTAKIQAARVGRRPAFSDPKRIDSAFSPDVLGLAIGNPTTGERMIGRLFTAQGEGPHPTVLLLHGFPGYEGNGDLAHAFQRAGYTTVVFHYRGCWGSEGLFSLCNVLEDVGTAIDFIRENAGDEDYRFDPERLVLVGHSMGGFAALETAAGTRKILGAAAVSAFDFSLAAQDPAIGRAVRESLEDNLPIHRKDLETVMREIDEHSEEWHFPALAQKLARRPLYLISGSRESVAVPSLHLTPLLEAMRRIDGATVACDLLDAEHSYSDRRVELTDKLLAWLDGVFGGERRDDVGG